jgi:hypothetical protein
MNDCRDEPIDPEGRYPACGLRRVDRIAHRVRSILPDARVERTRDVYQFIVDAQDGLVVHETYRGQPKLAARCENCPGAIT